MQRLRKCVSSGDEIFMGDVTTLTGMVFEMLLKHLPKWLIRRIYPTAKIANEIEIVLRDNRPIQISKSDIPKISVHFNIINHSLIDLVLDRLFINIYVGSQPILFGTKLERHEIPKRRTTEIYFENLLASSQYDYLEKKCNPKIKMIDTINMDVKIYFESDSGIIEIENGHLYAQNVQVW